MGTVAKQQIATLQDLLEKSKGQIAAALPKHMTADRMARIALTEVRRTPKLQECNPLSVIGSIIQASQLGLEPGGGLGHAYLVPYKNECQLIIGYRGMIDLARRSREIISISARTVHENDEFRYQFGLHEDLHHAPATAERGKITHVYAVAHLHGGGVQWDVMSVAEIEAVREQSKAGRNGPWLTHWAEMAKKTVIRRLFKYLPVSVEIQRAVGLDELADVGKQGSVFDGEWQPAPETEEDIRGQLSASAQAEPAAKESLTFAEVAGQINSAPDPDRLDMATRLIHRVEDAGQRDELEQLAAMRESDLAAENV